MSSAAQLRKIKKPLIEKRRRERMNECLNQLKTLVLDGKNTSTNESRYSKMEKVDILEMTVRYLEDLRRVLAPCSGSPASFVARYVEGYSECATQVRQYLTTAKDINDNTCQRLYEHLNNSLRNSNPLRSSEFGSPFPPSESRATKPSQFLKPPSPVEPQGASPVPIGPGGLDCGVYTLASSKPVPAMFAIFPNLATQETGSFNHTGNPSPITPSGVIPLIVAPSVVRPSAASCLTTTSVTLNSRQCQSAESSTNNATIQLPVITQTLIKAEAPQTVLLIARKSSSPQGLCCSSPPQGDEYPSSLFLLEHPRSHQQPLLSNCSTKTQSTISTNICAPSSGSTVERQTTAASALSEFDGREQETLPLPVWRPWSGNVAETS